MKKNYKLLVPTPTGSSMNISTRIFTLVAFCLGLLALTSGIGIWQMNNIGMEINRIAERNVPLTGDLTEITVHRLKQSINFERAFHAGEVMDEHIGAMTEFKNAVQTFEELTVKINKEFDEVEKIALHAKNTAVTEDGRTEFEGVLIMLGVLSKEHKDYDRLSRKAFKAIRAGNLKQNLTILPEIEAREEELNYQLERILHHVESFNERAALTADEHKNFALTLLVAITIIAIISGTCVAVLMVRRYILRPLDNIIAGFDALNSGDMSVDVDVYNDDEISAVARSYVVFKHTLMSLKKKEEELESSRQRFKTLVESTNVVPWEFYPKIMRFTYVGPQIVDLFGYQIEDWYTEGFWENIIHPDDREEAIGICKKSAELSEDHDFEYRMSRADGGYLWVRNVSSVVNEEGQRMMFRGVFIDITAKKNSEVELRESEQRFKDIVEISSDWIWECDENLRFTFLTDRFEQVAHVPKELILGKTRHEIGKNDEADWDAHLADLEARRSFRAFNYSVKDENGEMRHCTVSGRPIFDADGNFKGYRGTGADRTAKVQAEAELVRHRDHLQELVDTATQEIQVQAVELREALAKEKKLNKLQREFVSMASHEFRTPLAIIDATAQRMKRRAGKNQLTPEDALQRVEKIRGAVRRMTRLMESTLTAARMQEGKIEINIEPCDIGKVVQEVCMRQQDVAQSHIITCELADLPDTIQADLGSLDQIFTNLLSNAVKYAPGAPEIHVQARSEGGQVVISVHDHGIGIDEDDLPKMFERFFRANTSVGIAGTGIGLNLVKTLVEMHGGSISIESKQGEGSTFTVYLPVAGPSQSEKAA